jgi:hypothetical protein
VEASADFYAPLADRLSQGDLVKEVPWGLIDAPLTVCQPDVQGRTEGKAKYSLLGAAGFRGSKIVHAKAQIGPAMVLWHDCQLDKFENQGRPPEKWFAAIAPVRPLAEVGDTADAVRRGDRRAFFYLPAYPDITIEQDSFVDLRHIWPVKQSALAKRFGTLSATARLALYTHLFTFLTSRRLRHQVQCPSCAAQIPAAALVEDAGEAAE